METSYVEKIQRQILAANLNDRIYFLGPLNSSNLAIRLRESHVMAVPSFYEGYGIAYIEGMGFGLPAVGTTAGAAGEIITHGEDGYLISPGDAQSLAKHLIDLNNDRDLLIALSLNALQRFRRHPTWQASCRQIAKYLVDQKQT